MAVLYKDGIKVYNFSNQKLSSQEGIIINEFDTTTQYNSGDYVIYDNQLYKATTQPTAGTFVESEWDLIGSEEFEQQGIIINPYKSTQSYSSGDYIIYNKRLYIALNDITGSASNLSPNQDSVNWEAFGGGEIIHQWSSKRAYTNGTYVSAFRNIYVANVQDLTTVGEWVSSEWTIVGTTKDETELSIYNLSSPGAPLKSHSEGTIAYSDVEGKRGIYRANTQTTMHSFKESEWDLLAGEKLRNATVVSSGDANSLVEPKTYFVWGLANLPYNGSGNYGFLEVEYFDGTGFAPSSTSGATKCVIQTFTRYRYDKNYPIKVRRGYYRGNLDTEWQWDSWANIDEEWKNGIALDGMNVNTYGADILHLPVGKYYFTSHNDTSSYINLPETGIAGVLIITSMSPTKNVNIHAWCYKNYEFTTYNGTRYVRSLCSGSTAGVYSTDTGWQKLSTATVNIETYNNISQIGLTDVANLEAIATTLPENSCLIQNIVNNTSFPGGPYGTLIAIKRSYDNTIFKYYPNNDNDENSEYTCNYHPNTGLSSWAKTCTTKVADTNGVVTVTAYNRGTADIEVNYMVKNGICEADITVELYQTLSDTNWGFNGSIEMPCPLYQREVGIRVPLVSDNTSITVSSTTINMRLSGILTLSRIGNNRLEYQANGYMKGGSSSKPLVYYGHVSYAVYDGE